MLEPGGLDLRNPDGLQLFAKLCALTCCAGYKKIMEIIKLDQKAHKVLVLHPKLSIMVLYNAGSSVHSACSNHVVYLSCGTSSRLTWMQQGTFSAWKCGRKRQKPPPFASSAANKHRRPSQICTTSPFSFFSFIFKGDLCSATLSFYAVYR